MMIKDRYDKKYYDNSFNLHYIINDSWVIRRIYKELRQVGTDRRMTRRAIIMMLYRTSINRPEFKCDLPHGENNV